MTRQPGAQPTTRTRPTSARIRLSTLRGAAELVGCDHKTVAHWVRAREQAGGGLAVSVQPRPAVDPFAVKIEEWVDRSRGQIIRLQNLHDFLWTQP